MVDKYYSYKMCLKCLETFCVSVCALYAKAARFVPGRSHFSATSFEPRSRKRGFASRRTVDRLVNRLLQHYNSHRLGRCDHTSDAVPVLSESVCYTRTLLSMPQLLTLKAIANNPIASTI